MVQQTARRSASHLVASGASDRGEGVLEGQGAARSGVVPGLWARDTGRVGRDGRRAYAALLVERASWLPHPDRALVEGVYAEGNSVVAYVRRCVDAGVDPVPDAGIGADDSAVDALARIARRRLRRLEKRLASDRFAFVIARRNTWGLFRRRVAMLCIVQGASMRAAARELGLTLHTVRSHMHAVEAMLDEHAESARAARREVVEGR